MLQTFEALIDEQGQIRFVEPVNLRGGGRVLITLLSNDAIDESPVESGNANRRAEPSVRDEHGTSLIEFFRQSPMYGIELDLTRRRDMGREVEL